MKTVKLFADTELFHRFIRQLAPRLLICNKRNRIKIAARSFKRVKFFYS